MGRIRFFTFICCTSSLFLHALCGWSQHSFEFDQSVEVIEEDALRLPWGGGLNSGQYHTLDVDQDGTEDLVIFDRSSNKVSCFLSRDEGYIYSPEYEYLFPDDLNGWIVLADYNCDGLKDLFTSSVFGMKVYTGMIEDDFIAWELAADPVNTLGFSGEINLQVNSSDIPAIVDIDDDGDLDIFVFNFARGGTIEFHKNQSIEEEGVCGLKFQRVTQKWGNFEECNCGIYAFDTSCADIEGKVNGASDKILHAGGKALLLLDYNGDGVKDMLFGDEECQELVYFENFGDSAQADFQTFEDDFPENQPNSNFFFPAGYYADVDQDGIRDLLIAPNLSANPSNQVDYMESSWLYKNTGTSSQPQFTFVQNDFLQNEMIDLGENAAPAFADLSGDGKVDMLIGNRGSMRGGKFVATLAYYENHGSASAPSFVLSDDDFLNISELELLQVNPSFADLNGDGFQDLYFTGTSTVSNQASVHYLLSREGDLNEGTAISSLPIALSSNDKLSFADISKDGYADLVIFKSTGRLEYHKFIGNPSGLAYALEEENFAGFSDKFENRNLTSTLYDINENNELELIVSDANGTLYLIRDFLTHTSGLEGAIPISIHNEVLETDHSTRFGRNARVAFAHLFEGEMPTMVVGSQQGGLYLLRNRERGPTPGGGEDLTLDVFPNPTQGWFKIEPSDDVEVVIYDASGRKVANSFFIRSGVEHVLDSRRFAAGVYILKATNGAGESIARKLIVI